MALLRMFLPPEVGGYSPSGRTGGGRRTPPAGDGKDAV